MFFAYKTEDLMVLNLNTPLKYIIFIILWTKSMPNFKPFEALFKNDLYRYSADAGQLFYSIVNYIYEVGKET